MAAQPPQPAPCRTCGRASPDDVLVCPHDGSQLPLERRLLDGKFRLEKRLGHGGMASVWQATNEFIERPVAIKLMHARYAEDADLLARFRNEATAAGRIGSPHICDVLDFGRSAIGPYIVMELLSGCSLSDLIHAYTKIDPGLAVWIVRQTLDGLDAAHRAGIVHRDLKPENIYLCRAIRDQWLVKLMDFGISKFNDSLRTGAGTTMGSPNYMAPEQIRGAEAVDARADLWSIGAILYEAVTGASPFARDTIADSLAAVRNFDPPPLHTRVPEVPPGLSEIVARCLHKPPELRWPSAQALSDALRPFERPGTRMREPPPEPNSGVPVGTTTMRRSGAAPRALVEAAREPASSARSKSTDKPPSGPYPPVSGARPGVVDRPPSVAQPGPSARAGTVDRGPTGAHAPVPSARPGAADRPPSAARSGTHERVAGPTGPHAPVPNARSTGPHAPVPSARPTGPTGAQAPVSPARPADVPIATTAPLSGAFKPLPRSLARKAAAAAAAAPAPAASPAPAAARPTRAAWRWATCPRP
jgi:serine/threonine-protein kinase